MEGPTPWVLPVAIVPKKEGKIRVCVDMRLVNKSIKRERHITLTVNEVINDLNGLLLPCQGNSNSIIDNAKACMRGEKIAWHDQFLLLFHQELSYID